MSESLSRRGLTVARLNELLCQAPARLAKLHHCKGRIKAGYDGDLVIWSPHLEHTIREDRIQHKNKVTPYLNRTLQGLVQRTFVAGREVFNRETGFCSPPSGEIIVNRKIFSASS